jgi:type 2A phosphatase activator TIP41
MPTCFFILSRFTLRVDHVLFRTHDTRIYHSFASAPPLLVREVAGWEAPYECVQKVGNVSNTIVLFGSRFWQYLPKRDDMTPLTDPTFIAKILTELPKHTSQKEGAKTSWRGMGSRTEVVTLS